MRGAVLLLLLLASLSHAAVIRLKVEGPPAKAAGLLEKLQEHGFKRGLQFESTAEDFDYRIIVDAGQRWSTFDMGAKGAAVVLSPDCEVVGVVQKGGRWTTGGALNAMAKQLVKLLGAQPTSSPSK